MQKTATKPLSLFIGIFLLSIPLSLSGQDENEVTLLNVILQMETAHEILFSYVIDEVKAYKLAAPEVGLSLEATIDYLNDNTTFRIQKISDRYYSVSRIIFEGSEFCGRLIDGGLGNALENATITTLETGYSTLSDGAGKFYIPEKQKNESIQITYIGYESLIISSKDLNFSCPEIIMLPSISKLNEVLISSILVKGINRNVDGSTSLNTNNFGLLPGQTERDVLQMAQSLPGVESINETISTINIRGGTNDENLIQWEGIRMYQLGHFFGLISAFNPNLTKDLTIYKNGTPANFGESVSGVISMSSNDQIAQKIRGGIGSNLINSNAFLEMPVSKRLGVQISGRSSINGLFKTPVYNNFSDRVFQDTEITNNQNSASFTNVTFKEDFYFFDVGGKVLWDLSPKDKIRFNFIAMENHFEFSERLSESEETSRLEQKSEAAGISWQRQWSSNFVSTASVHATHYLLDALNQDIFTLQEINQENEVLDLGLKLDTRTILSQQFDLNTGYQFSEIGIANLQDINLPRFRDYEKDVLRSHILYGDLVYRSKDKKSRLNLGVRANYFEKFNEVLIEPRIHAYQELSNGFAIEASGEFKSQSLTQRIDLQSDFLGIEKRRWVLANGTDIPIKKSQQASLGLLYNKNKWFLNLEGFLKKVDHIFSKSQGFQNQFQFASETGSYSVYGLEVTVNKKIGDFSAWISYGYGKNDFQFENFVPSEFANNVDIRHTVNVASSYTLKNFKFALGLNWRTGKPYTIPKEGAPPIIGDGFLVIDFDEPNAERINDYLRLDFSTEYVWHISERVDAVFNLSLINLTNEKNSLNIRYTLEDNLDFQSDINRIEETSLGFTPNFAFQVLF
jgi:outer membrane receptor for ferrienterochelin and colicin